MTRRREVEPVGVCSECGGYVYEDPQDSGKKDCVSCGATNRPGRTWPVIPLIPLVRRRRRLWDDLPRPPWRETYY